jgi:hypothetical protein
MKKPLRLFAVGNSKLHPSILTWNIPASMEVCGRVCKGCYARSTMARWKTVKNKWEANYELSKTDEFVKLASEELHQKSGTYKYVRLHGSGEFYSQEYVDKWVILAKAFPDIMFYTYTKRYDDFNFSELLALPNFVLHNSILEGGGINYDKQEAIEKIAEELKGFVCPLSTDREQKCGLECTWCMVKENQDTPILFIKH